MLTIQMNLIDSSGKQGKGGTMYLDLSFLTFKMDTIMVLCGHSYLKDQIKSRYALKNDGCESEL